MGETAVILQIRIDNWTRVHLTPKGRKLKDLK